MISIAIRTMFVFLVVALMIIAPFVNAQETKQTPAVSEQKEREAMYYRYWESWSLLKGGSIKPRWMADGSNFWYAEGVRANTVIYKVDPKANTKTPFFNTARLRKALTPLLGHEPPYQGLPFVEFTFLDGEKAVRFSLEDKEFILDLQTYTIKLAPVFSQEEKNRMVPGVLQGRFGWGKVREILSPNRLWFAGIKEYNVYVRSALDGHIVQLTDDGIEDDAYEIGSWPDGVLPGLGWSNTPALVWSANSSKLAVKKVDSRKVPKMSIVHYLTPNQKVESLPYRKIGDSDFQTKLYILDPTTRRRHRVDIGQEKDQHIYLLTWRPDGSELLFLRIDRWQRRLDLMAADPTTGSTRILLTEIRKTGITIPPPKLLTLLNDGRSFIWRSQRDGWDHLYLYDLNGTLKVQLTEQDFHVLRVVAVDEAAGWVYFTAHADPKIPLESHVYRVNLEGKNLTRVTEAKGQHDEEWFGHIEYQPQFSPSMQFFLDAHSDVDRPPSVDLRRADGTLLQTLSKASFDVLNELKWSPPERFVVKAADGKTDLNGVLFKPYDFNPNRKYPVIESIYGGNQSIVSRDWNPARFPHALAQLGFITFIVDNRGLPTEGKDYQDLVYGNLGRYEIPDHVAALKQLAEQRPYMDLSRVGIYGGTYGFGSYMTLRALLLAPDVYHVGVAGWPEDIAESNPFKMGPPEQNKEGYEYASNLRLAANLKGKLLLIHGTSDPFIPFTYTMKMVEALIQAGKYFNLLVIPDGFLDSHEEYQIDAIRRYFQEHLKP